MIIITKSTMTLDVKYRNYFVFDNSAPHSLPYIVQI